MGKTLEKRSFAEKFTVALAERDVGKRTLARRISDRRGGRQSVDTIRRLLNKYARGVTPTDASRHEIEDELGMSRDSLKPDGDDEDESDPAMRIRRIRAELVLLNREDLADDLKTLVVFAPRKP